MYKIHKKLVTYSYNITGSYEDARDLVQDVLEKYIQLDKTGIEDETNYLIRSVINHSINFKKRQKKLAGYGMPLPEPISSETADKRMISTEMANYSLLVLMEYLTPKERAVFVLKEGFGYSHDEIATALSISPQNARKLLSRAKEKLGNKTFTEKEMNRPQQLVSRFVHAIQHGEVKTLESLLGDDIRLAADGGRDINVVAALTTGIADTVQVLTYVYQAYQRDLQTKLISVNHQPALLYYKGNKIISCQVFEVAGEKIHRIFSVVDPRKLQQLSLDNLSQ